MSECGEEGISVEKDCSISANMLVPGRSMR